MIYVYDVYVYVSERKTTLRKISGVVGFANLARFAARLTVFAALLSVHLSALSIPVAAQESAEFALRGTIIETLTTFEGDERALIHANQFAYWVTCDSGSGGCAADLIDATGQCADIWGDVVGDFTIPPAGHEYYEAELVVAPSDCSTERSLFLFIGHITSSVSPSVSVTGNTEFEVAVNSEIFHVVCPSGSGRRRYRRRCCLGDA